MSTFELNAIGKVESSLTEISAAPRQADEGAPDAWLVFDQKFVDGLLGLRPGDRVLLFTWLDRADRAILVNHPRGDPTRPQRGVFTTRSPHRPNPIGLHEVEVVAVEHARGRVRVRSLEALDGTPIVDMKQILDPDISRR
jgi:tRNA-Thr(GGU) m(6)t(6)A37 methyltransferase TsaA